MIYIVEDDENIRQMETYALKNSGYEVDGFGDGEAFFAACEKRLPSLAILDIMLPGDDGLEILRKFRGMHRCKSIPVIMVTAKSSELDAVKGLDSGADDYITKPFGIMELISRVKAVLRRMEASGAENSYQVGGIYLNTESHSVTVDHRECELTYKEFELLKYLMANQGIVLTRDRIMDRVWGMDYEGESRTVDVHIKTLRQKLGEAGSAIKTVRNVGYKIT